MFTCIFALRHCYGFKGSQTTNALIDLERVESYFWPPGDGRLFDMKVLNAFMRTYFALFEKSRNNEGVHIVHL